METKVREAVGKLEAEVKEMIVGEKVEIDERITSWLNQLRKYRKSD
jgi:hypothetical protein